MGRRIHAWHMRRRIQTGLGAEGDLGHQGHEAEANDKVVPGQNPRA
jgi:hypothetical protein